MRRHNPRLTDRPLGRRAVGWWIAAAVWAVGGVALAAPKPKGAGAAPAAPAPTAPAPTPAAPQPAPPAQASVKLIEGLSARLDGLVKQHPTLAKLHDAIGADIRQHMDYEEMGRMTLGDTVWSGRDAGQRQTFVDLLAKMVERSYVKRFSPGRQVKVEVDQTPKAGKDGRVQVRTKVSVGQTRAAVAYSMVAHGGSWRVYDIVVDETSQLATYRKTFRKILANEGWDGLLARMRRSAKE